MDSINQSSWKNLIKSLVPPLLMDLYQGVRHRQSQALTQNGIKAQNVQFILPTRSLNELFPDIEWLLVTTPVSELYRPRDMVVPLPELLTLAAICRYVKPRRIFEIGTYTGSSTLVMAINSPADTQVLTLDLQPSEIVGSVYRNTNHSSRIQQLYGNSLSFDYTPYQRSVDLVLVDANHSYEYVKSDTEKAFALLRPGGVIVWDDYRWLEVHPECAGVTVFLNELQVTRPIYSLAGTRFAIYLDNGHDQNPKP